MSTVSNSQYSQSLNPQYREFITCWDKITGGTARTLGRTGLTIALSSIPNLPLPAPVLVEIIIGGAEEFNTTVWYPITREFMDKHIQPLFESNPVTALARNWLGI